MQGMSGEQTLQETKQFRPEVQVIMLTGFGSLESAVEVGKMDAFSYLKKPCDLAELIQTILKHDLYLFLWYFPRIVQSDITDTEK